MRIAHADTPKPRAAMAALKAAGTRVPDRAYETRVMITGNADAILAALKDQPGY